MNKIQRALISVSDKAGIADFARGLQALGIEILSTGGTARLLAEAGIPVTEVSDYTGFPEMMDGRVKTLHPKIHGGILARRGMDEAVMAANGIGPIDMVVVNLYPFEQTVARADCDLPMAIENIDIGGPTLLRAAAKNHAAVTVIVDSADYAAVLAELQQQAGQTTPATRYALAVKTFEHTARYDGAIANYLGAINAAGEQADFPNTLTLQYRQVQTMRYGENPHQRAAFFVEHAPQEASVATARQLQGKELSYNNVADTDAALECVKSFTEAPACVIVKHANPCGVALGADPWRPTSAPSGLIRPRPSAASSPLTGRWMRRPRVPLLNGNLSRSSLPRLLSRPPCRCWPASRMCACWNVASGRMNRCRCWTLNASMAACWCRTVISAASAKRI